MDYMQLTDSVVIGIELLGVAVIVGGLAVAVVHATVSLAFRRDTARAYDLVRQGTGRALMLGLEVLIAAEIVRSIAAETLESVAVLGLTILIRTFLSLALTVEIEERWPWEKSKRHRQSSGPNPQG